MEQRMDRTTIATLQARYEAAWAWRSGYQGSAWLPWPTPGRVFVTAERCGDNIKVFVEQHDGTWVYALDSSVAPVLVPSAADARMAASAMADREGLPIRSHARGFE